MMLEYNYKKKKIVFFSLINGVGNSTISYQLSRLLRVPLCQEQKNDIVHFLRDVVDSEKRNFLKQVYDLNNEDYKEGAVYDLKTPNKKILNLATDIVVLTNNSYLDILKTIATLKLLNSLLFDKKKSIHIVFNRLQNANPAREKKYTNVSKELILSNSFGMNITFSYIRNSLIYYRDIQKGKFFMDSFFKENNIFVKDYSEILEIEHTHYLEMFYDNQYEDKEYSFHEFVHFDEIKKHRTEYAIEQNEKKSYGMKEVETTPKAMDAYIAKTMLHQQNIRLSRVAIKDMFSFLYKIGGIYENYSERQDGSKINRKNIEVA
jgi:hypothetical protein